VHLERSAQGVDADVHQHLAARRIMHPLLAPSSAFAHVSGAMLDSCAHLWAATPGSSRNAAADTRAEAEKHLRFRLALHEERV
jgi:hypothetical protein